MARFLLYNSYQDLFGNGVLHNLIAEKYPQYLNWVMPAQGTSKRLRGASFY